MVCVPQDHLRSFHIWVIVSKGMSMSCGNTRKASILLVRKLYTLMQNLGPLPDSVSLNMKLAYYEEGKAAHAPPRLCCQGAFETPLCFHSDSSGLPAAGLQGG